MCYGLHIAVLSMFCFGGFVYFVFEGLNQANEYVNSKILKNLSLHKFCVIFC